VVRRVACTVPAGALALVAGPSGVLVVVVAGALGWLWGLAAHDRAGWARGEGTVVLARGVLVHRIDLVPLARVQSTRTVAGLLARRAGLAAIHVDVAGGATPHLRDLDEATAADLLRRLPRQPP
jgi:membrane protein YdbS with pleckstrin-like domain